MNNRERKITEQQLKTFDERVRTLERRYRDLRPKRGVCSETRAEMSGINQLIRVNQTLALKTHNILCK